MPSLRGILPSRYEANPGGKLQEKARKKPEAKGEEINPVNSTFPALGIWVKVISQWRHYIHFTAKLDTNRPRPMVKRWSWPGEAFDFCSNESHRKKAGKLYTQWSWEDLWAMCPGVMMNLSPRSPPARHFAGVFDDDALDFAICVVRFLLFRLPISMKTVLKQ